MYGVSYRIGEKKRQRLEQVATYRVGRRQFPSNEALEHRKCSISSTTKQHHFPLSLPATYLSQDDVGDFGEGRPYDGNFAQRAFIFLCKSPEILRLFWMTWP